MALEATYRHGKPVMVDHTPSSAVAAGEVVVVGSGCRVAHRAIAANELGALAAAGGVYDLVKEAALAISDGDVVYWDDTANEADKTGTNDKFGIAVADADAADATVRVLHLAD